MARGKSEKAGAEAKQGRLAQIRQTYKMARRVYPRIGWTMLAIALVVFLVAVGLGLLVGPLWMWILLGLPVATLSATIYFGRRAESAAFTQIEGQPGAAASALQLLRKGWTVEPAIAVTRQQDMVHRVLGKPGIVLVAEGNPNRAQHLLNQERKRHARVAVDFPIHTMTVGDDEGQVPLRKLSKSIRKLPKSATPADITEVRNRLRAMPTKPVPMPKGPMPKNARLPKGMGQPPR